MTFCQEVRPRFALYLVLVTTLTGCDDYLGEEYKRAMDEAGSEKVRQIERQMDEAKEKRDKTLKPYRIPGDQIQELIPNMGACFATDRILIDGSQVGYMYRERPDYPEDSGWRFLAGDETDEYMDDDWNTGIFSVNTVCNYDPEIIPFLDSPEGSVFARDSSSGSFHRIDEPPPIQ